MTLNEYIKELTNLVTEHPECGELTAIFAKDAEGNGYNEVYYTPTLDSKCLFDEYDAVFCDDIEDDEEPNAICIN